MSLIEKLKSAKNILLNATKNVSFRMQKKQKNNKDVKFALVTFKNLERKWTKNTLQAFLMSTEELKGT